MVAGECAYAFRGKPHERGRCLELVAGPTRLYACADGRAYTVIAGRWQDAGPLTATPNVPAG